MRQPGFRFEFFRAERALNVRITNMQTTNMQINAAPATMELPLQWAFGAGRQAVTFVSRVDKDWYLEHYTSYFTTTGAWGPTPGQDALHPNSINEAAGVLYKTADPANGVDGCFACHSTGAVAFDSAGEARVGEAGVRCEACHGAGAEHASGPSRQNIGNPGRLSADALNRLCGQCHRQPAAEGTAVDWNYAWNVRHQPLYLNQSVCFRKSGGALTCLTCHDPHEPAAQKTVASWNSRCNSCHSGDAPVRQPAAVCLRNSPANCVDCHMPLVSPQAGLRFTNHRIGIYRDGAKLIPIR
jgi:hypothetical protein